MGDTECESIRKIGEHHFQIHIVLLTCGKSACGCASGWHHTSLILKCNIYWFTTDLLAACENHIQKFSGISLKLATTWNKP